MLLEPLSAPGMPTRGSPLPKIADVYLEDRGARSIGSVSACIVLLVYRQRVISGANHGSASTWSITDAYQVSQRITYATADGSETRGSRPVFGSADVLWKVEMSHWYGWPDYSEGRPLTASFYSEGDGKPRGFVLANHPEKPPRPRAYLPVHSSADGLDFTHGEAFGYPGWAFIALFGDMAPTAGKVLAPVGFEIVRVDPKTGDIAEFARNRGDKPGPASLKHQRGLERPIAVRFDPSGRALYVVDFGVIRMTDAGPQPERGSGRIWRIVKEARYAGD